ncbi:MAG: hypothetical protein Q4D38_06220 [Planctomycetia bacterium]|nr:hypothetical protein [Planctomycetia bacterium]
MKLFQLRDSMFPAAFFCLLGFGMSAWAQDPLLTDEVYYQHVKIVAPEGVQIAPAADGTFIPTMEAPQIYAFQLGKTYRLRVINISLFPGVELYPTIEIVDRTHPPVGEEIRHAVVVELAREDLIAAISGKFVKRIIYIEDPETALPVAQTSELGQGYFDVPAETDAYAMAKTLGRPIVILRIGGRAPEEDEVDMSFLFDCPPFLHYPPQAPVAP